ncbi:MAG: putative DNA modification/repair radical SAM protein [Clostridia bacterium]|jgi:putative DNA modification/repair radical SAM protein|nr:putative DNA modification/repair radical SAM protein [Clostridia bacterium]
MEITDKLKILSDSAKYDVSCSSSGSNRKNKNNGIGNSDISGICHTWGADGRCISLLKVLLSNNCIYDCKYCINKVTNSIKRATFTPQEVADITINFYKRNYIEGLFLSSAVIKSPNYTMELLIQTISILRNEYNFNGYIHCKTIPGCSKELIDILGILVDRLSINIELPSYNSLKLLAPQKQKHEILEPMSYISNTIKQNELEKNKFKPNFVPAGQTTQLIIGATPETDLKILKLSENLYQKLNLKRVYYSAYISVNQDTNLPTLETPPLLRENRLYQADWLLRYYGFKTSELLDETHPNFNHILDPKCDWALRNIDKFPVEINSADYFTLIRIPGIGIISAKKILKTRREFLLDFDSLKKLGISLKKAQYFITCKGKYFTNSYNINLNFIETNLISLERSSFTTNFKQLSIFDNLLPTKEDRIKCLTGNI